MIHRGKKVIVEGATLSPYKQFNGVEGIVAKLRRSRYEPGRRSSAWVKTARMRFTRWAIWRPSK